MHGRKVVVVVMEGRRRRRVLLRVDRQRLAASIERVVPVAPPVRLVLPVGNEAHLGMGSPSFTLADESEFDELNELNWLFLLLRHSRVHGLFPKRHWVKFRAIAASLLGIIMGAMTAGLVDESQSH